MSDANDVWTVSYGNGWANRRAGSAEIMNKGRRKIDVVRIGRALARRDGVEHVILKEPGEIQRRNTYRRGLGAGAARLMLAERRENDAKRKAVPLTRREGI